MATLQLRANPYSSKTLSRFATAYITAHRVCLVCSILSGPIIVTAQSTPVLMATSYPVYGAPPQAQYPPAPNYNAPATAFNASTTRFNAPMGGDARLVRTPSLTPSEQEELLGNGPNYKKLLN